MQNIFSKSDVNVIEEYNGFAWKVINVRAEALANQDIYIERNVNDLWQPDETHEFNEVLRGRPGELDIAEFLEAHQVSMDLYGESFWYYSTGETSGLPMGRYLLDPQYVTVYTDGFTVKGYVYQKNQYNFALDVDEVDHYFIHNPEKPFRGVGAMQKAGWIVKSSRYTYTYINNFMENNAVPPGVIVAKSEVNNDDWELFKRKWNSRNSGIDNVGKTGYLRGQDIDFVKTGLSLGDFDFDKMKNASRDDVMAMFSIPKPMLGILDDVNRASSTVARQMFALSFTKPALNRIQRKLTRNVKDWYGDEYRIGTLNPVPEDREIKLNEYKEGVGRWITPNEAREAYGLDPIPNGDELKQDVKPPAEKKLKVKLHREEKKTGFTYEMKESFRSQTEDLQIKAEQEFWQTANPILEEQKKMVIDQLKPKKVIDTHFNAEEEAKKLADATQGIFIGLAKEQGQLAAQFVGNDDIVFDLNDVAQKFIRDSIDKATLGFTKDTQDKISTAVTTGLQEEESLTKIGKRINDIYDEATGVETPGYRIERLARTEVLKTSNEMTELAYKQSGVVSKKEWFANPGACEFCKALDGNVIQLGGTYVPEGAKLEGVDGGTRINSYESINHPPSHPACRCTLAPVLE